MVKIDAYHHDHCQCVPNSNQAIVFGKQSQTLLRGIFYGFHFMNSDFRASSRFRNVLLALFLTVGCSAVAESTPAKEAAPPPEKAPSLYDKIWSLPTLYSNPDNPVLQKFAISGKLQLQWAAGNSDHGSYGSRDVSDEVRWGDIEVRRMRLGFTSQWFGVWHLQGHADLNPRAGTSSGPKGEWENGIYHDLHDFYLTYAPSSAFKLSLGKNTAKYLSYEYLTSSSKILVFERSLLVGTLTPPELTGIWAQGEIKEWHYTVGLFSGDDRREFSRFNAGVVLQGSLGYDFKTRRWFDGRFERALVKLDYQYSSGPSNDDGPSIYNHAFSLNSDFQAGKWGLYTDFLGGLERQRSGGAYGVILTPSFYLTSRLQAVLRYQYAHGDHDSLRLGSRYDRLAPDLGPDAYGSDYNALYLGLNYYFYGHKLKLMSGAEYSRMSNHHSGTSFNGVTFLTGLRMYF